MKSQTGFLLIELLAASILMGFAGLGAMRLFSGTIQVQRILDKSAQLETPPRIAGLKLEKDLRNAIYIKEFPFQGSKDSLRFVTRTGLDENLKLVEIRYFLRDGRWLRSEEKDTERFGKEGSSGKTLILSIKNLSLSYPFQDPGGDISFHPFWPEGSETDPAFIPRAVQIQLTLENGELFSKMISLPQGRIARLEKREEENE